MTKEELLISEYEKKLNYLYSRANTKSKKKRIVYDLYNFSAICYQHFGIEKTFDWEDDEELFELVEDFLKALVNYTQKNKSDYLQISSSVIKTFIDVKYPFYADYQKLLYNLSPLKQEELVFDFLNNYDPCLLKFYQEKLERCEIFDTKLYAQTGYSGLNIPMDSLKKSFIFCEEGSNSIFSSAMLVHELGHSFEKQILYSIGINGNGTAGDKTPFTEVCSRFFEYAFYNYLKENRIYDIDTKICLLNYYKTMLTYIYGMNLICKLDGFFINKYGYVEIEDIDLSIYANKLKEALNYYDLPSKLGEELSYKHSFVYGLGSLFSLYLYDIYQKDPNYFKKEFRNALINYPYSGISSFENLGITMETLTSDKILRKAITNI